MGQTPTRSLLSTYHWPELSYGAIPPCERGHETELSCLPGGKGNELWQVYPSLHYYTRWFQCPKIPRQSTFLGLVPGPIPKFADAQVRYIKWPSTVDTLDPQVPHPGFH